VIQQGLGRLRFEGRTPSRLLLTGGLLVDQHSHGHGSILAGISGLGGRRRRRCPAAGTGTLAGKLLWLWLLELLLLEMRRILDVMIVMGQHLRRRSSCLFLVPFPLPIPAKTGFLGS